MKEVINIGKNNNFSSISLEVPSLSKDAKHIYEKYGFKEDDEQHIDYEDVWGGLTRMKLDLKSKT